MPSSAADPTPPRPFRQTGHVCSCFLPAGTHRGGRPFLWGGGREPRTLRPTPAPGSRLAWLWARAGGGGPFGEALAGLLRSARATVPPAPGPLPGSGGPGPGPRTLAPPQTPFTEHEHTVSLGAAAHSPVLWTVKVRLQGAKPRRSPSPLEQGPPLCAPAPLPSPPEPSHALPVPGRPTPNLAQATRSTHFC